MAKYGIILGVLLAFAMFNTFLLGFQLARFSPWAPQSPTNSTITSTQHYANQISASLDALQTSSVVLAPISWGAVIGAWTWRGRVRSEWGQLGLSEDLFRLLVKMRGSGTRSSILKALLTPKDRFQLAKDLNLDWTTVDYHVRVLLKYGLVAEDTAYGNVKLYKLTPNGDVMLKALEEMERKEIGRTSQSS